MEKWITKTALFWGLGLTFSLAAYATEDSLTQDIEQLMQQHYEQYKDVEYFSAIQSAVYLPEQGISSFHVGHVSRDKDAAPIQDSTLFQIGSITKSFTAAVVLKLEEEEKLSLADNISKWLPAYNKWGAISIKHLLNMTSGLPNYSDTPAWNYLEHEQLSRYWRGAELIDFVYPRNVQLNPPLKPGYFYSNTNYILTELAIEQVMQQSFKKTLEEQVIKPSGLTNTFYPIPEYGSDTKDRIISGYNFNQYDNPFLVGKDIITNNLSWAAGAGGLIATSEDVVKWVKTLFIDETLLNAKQKKQLTEIVSLATGEPITKTTADDPKGFGLGVIQAYQEEFGRYWYYEGETLGYRALYVYFPCNKVIVASLFNSAVNGENDHAHELVVNIYKAILKQNPQYQCQ